MVPRLRRVAELGPPPANAPFNADQAKKHQEAWARYLNVPVEYTKSIGMKLRLIPPGDFMMGSTKEDIEATIKDWRLARRPIRTRWDTLQSKAHKSFGPSLTPGAFDADSISRSNPLRSSRLVNIEISPWGVLGHTSCGRSQYNSTPFSSGSRR